MKQRCRLKSALGRKQTLWLLSRQVRRRPKADMARAQGLAGKPRSSSGQYAALLPALHQEPSPSDPLLPTEFVEDGNDW